MYRALFNLVRGTGLRGIDGKARWRNTPVEDVLPVKCHPWDDRIEIPEGATADLVEQLRAMFPEARLFPMYGLTEAFRSTYLDPDLVGSHPTSMGRAIPFAEVLVIDDHGQVAGAGEEGELVHCGPLVALGYWQDWERTAERFRPAPAGSARS